MPRFSIVCLIVLALSLSNALSAQSIQFEAEGPQINLQGALFGDLEFADVDNDGDQDLLICGRVSGWVSSVATRLYLNDGLGNFSEAASTPFPDVQNATLGFRDLDNDGDQDLLLSGQGDFPNYHADLFINDGTGSFSLMAGTPFPAHTDGAIAFADVDSDGDEDIFLSGLDTDEITFSKLYLNDGAAQFTESSEVFAFDYAGPLGFLDVDGDDDQDLIRVVTNADVISTEVHLNNGNGSFALVPNNLPGWNASAFCSGDIDMDGDMDLFFSGEVSPNIMSTALYLNDGIGTFSLNESSDIFPDLSIGENSFADFDNDGDLDIFMIGTGAGGLGSETGIISNVFENLGDNNYLLADSLTGAYVARHDIADINGDGLLDLVLSGVTVGDPNFATWIYSNISDISLSLFDFDIVVFELFPNPVGNELLISAHSRMRHITLRDVQGRVIKTQAVNGTSVTMDLSSLALGHYLIEVFTDKGSQTKRMIKR